MKKILIFIVAVSLLFVSCDKEFLKDLLHELDDNSESTHAVVEDQHTQTDTTNLTYTPETNAELLLVVEHEISTQGQSANLNTINTSNVTNMDAIFKDKTEFNGDVSLWDTSQVTSMKSMFKNASKFDGDVSGWNVGKVAHMDSMFENASEFTFKGDISKWDVSSVDNMSRMFANASLFNKDLSVWETKPETSDANILVGTQVYQTGGTSVLPKIDPSLQKVVRSKDELKAEIISAINSNGIDVNLNYIDTSQITDMSGLFENMTFKGDISRWDTSKVTNMSKMFKETSEFDGDISRWDTGEVRDMSEIFADNKFFRSDISAWDTKNVTTMNKMFYYSNFFSGVDKDLGKWDTSNVEDMSYMFTGNYWIETDIKDWNVSKVKNMTWMFGYIRVLETDLTNWDTSNVEDMSYMFYQSLFFNGDVKNFNTSKVKDMRWMFARLYKFNQDISGWDMSNVENIDLMFLQAEEFYQDLSSWDIASVKKMHGMFELTPMQDKTEWFPKKSETISQDTLESMIWISERNYANWCVITTSYDPGQPSVTTVSPPNPATKILVFDGGKFYYGNLTDFQYDDCPNDTEEKINKSGLIQLTKNASPPNYALTDEKEISYVIDGNSSKLSYGTNATLTVAEGEVAGKTKGTVFYILK